MNFLLGVFAICWVTGAFDSFTSTDTLRMGAYFVMLSMLLDKLDGFAARLVNASSEFGAQFDSLADLIAFGLAPAFCVFFAYKTCAPQFFEQNAALLVVTFSIYVLCAAMRLAKYNACDSDTYHHHFSGLHLCWRHQRHSGSVPEIQGHLCRPQLHIGFHPGHRDACNRYPDGEPAVLAQTPAPQEQGLQYFPGCADCAYLYRRIHVHFGEGPLRSGVPADSRRLLHGDWLYRGPYQPQQDYRRS